eukprot:scaffold4563_cov222-Chaetoceros_neogracile.AAC.5
MSTFNWKGILYKFDLKYDKSDFVKSTNVDAKCTSADGSDVVSIFKNPIKQELVGIDKELFDLVHVPTQAEKDTSDNYALRASALLQNSTDEDINGQNEVGNTPLHQAALAVRNHNIELLIAAGASSFYY